MQPCRCYYKKRICVTRGSHNRTYTITLLPSRLFFLRRSDYIVQGTIVPSDISMKCSMKCLTFINHHPSPKPLATYFLFQIIFHTIVCCSSSSTTWIDFTLMRTIRYLHVTSILVSIVSSPLEKTVNTEKCDLKWK